MEWIAVLLFLLLFVGAVIGEVQWLIRKGWASSGRAVGYVLTTDLLGFGIGSLVVLTVFFVMFMMVMGPAGTGSNIPESAYIATSAIGIIIPPVLLFLIKRLFLLVLKIKSGKPAWIYSVVSSLLIVLVVFVPPPLIYFLFMYIAGWK